MADVLDNLPPRWRQDRMLLGARHRWDDVEVTGDDDAILLRIDGPERPSLLGRGDPARVDALLVESGVGPAQWLSVPRGAQPGPATLARLELVPFSTWDFLSTDVPPPTVESEAQVRALDLDRDVDTVRACLREANPDTSADPAGAGELGWWGVVVDGVLGGVVGVSERGGAGDAPSWHVHGLGVLPRLRGRGLGTALTAAVVRAGLRSGASWVSLGMYAQNAAARRVYARLGFRTDAELTSFAPAGTVRPPA